MLPWSGRLTQAPARCGVDAEVHHSSLAPFFPPCRGDVSPPFPVGRGGLVHGMRDDRRFFSCAKAGRDERWRFPANPLERASGQHDVLPFPMKSVRLLP